MMGPVPIIIVTLLFLAMITLMVYVERSCARHERQQEVSLKREFDEYTRRSRRKKDEQAKAHRTYVDVMMNVSWVDLRMLCSQRNGGQCGCPTKCTIVEGLWLHGVENLGFLNEPADDD